MREPDLLSDPPADLPEMTRQTACFEMPSPFGTGEDRVLMLEPDSACAGELRARLLDGSYGRPYVIDDGQRRYLHFDPRLVQSVMRLSAPNALEVHYTRQMMSVLLFQPRPRQIVLIGLGGGSLVKFCHGRLPATRLLVLENNPDVIALRDLFRIPADGPCLQVLAADGAHHLAGMSREVDVLLVDAFDKEGYAPALAGPEFFRAASAALSGSGVLAVNLAGNEEIYAEVVAAAREVFDDRVLVVPVQEDDNQILLAFRAPSTEFNWRRLRQLARELRSRYELDFPGFVDRIERAARRQRASRQ